ncbi:MAG: hypothetical protein J5850_00380 [Clostridia bacterium]|nr:hypothetical protein [Clostridia bacterium]
MASTNNYPKKSFQEREQQRIEYVNKATREVTQDAKSFNDFLEVQSHFERYSLNNNLLIASQRPDASRIKSMEQWNADGFRVKKGSKKIWIYEPEQRVVGDKTYTNYKAKSMFDIKDIENAKPTEKVNYPLEKVLEAIVSEKDVQMITLQSYPENKAEGMYYDPEKHCIFAKQGMPTQDVFVYLTMALAHAEMAKDDSEYIPADHEFEAKCAANIMCRKYDVPTDLVKIAELPEGFKTMSEKEIRASLSDVNKSVKKFSKDIYHSLVKGKEENEPVKETEVRGDVDERS